ncbi:hypothetical protein WMY93_033614 [Mugilogobius chulae]|uniref:Uncharacterized protein n=1 Tax=Mugilogobius chulae TaxID=88201 RepID=A0AAW0MME5_9GOBI
MSPGPGPAVPVKLFPVTCEYIKGEKQFYYRAQRFYEDVEPSEEGMLGDFVEISDVDLEQSRSFLSRFILLCVFVHVFVVCVCLLVCLCCEAGQILSREHVGLMFMMNEQKKLQLLHFRDTNNSDSM